MKICVVGTGYVGLVTGTCLADLGNQVVCIDNNPKKLDVLNDNGVPFYEPGLEERIRRSKDAGRLSFSSDLSAAVQNSELVFIAVGTPPLESGKADLSAVFSVASSVLEVCQGLAADEFKVIITKSTVPVGTGKKLCQLRDEAELTASEVAVVSNPEFLREGTAIYDFFHPDRIVIGSDSEAALDKVASLYEPLYRTEAPIVRTDLQTSELSKYASNAFLATKISFINEMATLCELTGATVSDISKIMGMDGRIGRYFLHPGPGYGGSCFPKDTQALVHTASEVGYDLKVVKAVESVNKQQKGRVIEFVKERFSESLTGVTVAVLGLAFKPNTDDVRDASSLVIIEALLSLGATVRAFDPEVKSVTQFDSHASFFMAENAYDAASGANAVMLVTEWNAFRELDLSHLRSQMADGAFFDLRNVYNEEKLAQHNFDYTYIIGQPRGVRVR